MSVTRYGYDFQISIGRFHIFLGMWERVHAAVTHREDNDLWLHFRIGGTIYNPLFITPSLLLTEELG